MIVTADPHGDYNATSQILRYSALAREVTVPRIPSVTSTILAGTTANPKSVGHSSGRSTPSDLAGEIEAMNAEVARLREALEITQIRLEEEMQRRIEAEASWTAAEARIHEVEADIREEVWSEMEAKLALEQRRWRAARDEELDRNDEHLDRKLEILASGISIYDDNDKENNEAGLDRSDSKMRELAQENADLQNRLASMEREKTQRSPSKKMKVLKTRKWEGSGIGLSCSP
jgi:chromosome segregation ATPase